MLARELVYGVFSPHFAVLRVFASLAQIFCGLRFVALSGLLIFDLVACSSFPLQQWKEPIVKIDAIEVQNATLSGIEALLTLDVENPNLRNIVADGFDYVINVGGVELLTGHDSRSFTIEAQEHQKITLPVYLAYSNLLEVVPRVLQTGKLDYVAQGKVYIGSYIVPFEKAGHLQLPQAQSLTN